MPCQSCRRNAPTRNVTLYQNIGMLFMRQRRQISGNLCRRCIRRHGLRLTGLTLVTGWWGTISFFLNVVFIINNSARLLATLGMSDAFPPGQAPAPSLNAVAGSAVSPARPATPPALPAALVPFQQDIRLRLRSGEPVPQVAAYYARLTSTPMTQALPYVQQQQQQQPV